MKHPESRNTLHLEDAEIVAHVGYPDQQHIMRLHAPLTVATAQPGNFVHLQCDALLPLRRPMSIMRVDRQRGWLEVLYKATGDGSRCLAQHTVGEAVSVIGPIGVPFKLEHYRRYPLLVGGGVGIPPMIFLAEHINATQTDIQPLTLMGSEIPFPFSAKPSTIMVNGIPPEVTASIPLLEDLGLPSRLASQQAYTGCYDGYVTGLADHWLRSLNTQTLAEVELFGCGPTPMLKAVSKLAEQYGLPCQVSLEEYMACGVGGCAGCTVLVKTAMGNAMQRVCVDGPVFDAHTVFP